MRAALEDASDEAFLGLQAELHSEDLLDGVTPALADAYAQRWLRLAARPREWFEAQGFWDAGDTNGDEGPMVRINGDPAALVGANWRLAVAQALAADAIASESRQEAIRIVAAGGGPVLESIRNSVVGMDAAERRALDVYDLLAPAFPPASAGAPAEYDAAASWIFQDVERPLGQLKEAFRDRLVRELAEAADPAPLSTVEASFVLAQYAVLTPRRPAALEIFKRVRWSIDLSRLPAPLARALLDAVPHAQLPSDVRTRLFGGVVWTNAAIRAVAEKGDLGALNLLTRWRVGDAARALREIANRPGNFYPADAAVVALAALGDKRALELLTDMFRRGPTERVWQLMNEPLPYAPTPEIIGILLEVVADGRREALEVLFLLQRWFGRQVEFPHGAGPYDRAAAIAAWRDWWTTNGSNWCWDPWSARFWPSNVWSDD